MFMIAHRIWNALGIAACAVLIASAPMHAAEVATADLEAAVHSLGFLDSLQHRAAISVSVVYRSGDAESKALAQRTAATLMSMRGPNASTIAANVVAINELGQNPRHVDVLYLVPGAAENGRVIGDFVRRQHVLSISNDPSCLDARCCVLMVQAGSHVNIVLDTALAQETGATFSAVFTMMVKRR
jgi:hypothetical protein